MQVISDLHLEMRNEQRLEYFFNVSAPYLALAGDIGNPWKEHYEDFLSQCSSKYQRVFLVSGNHEYYNRNGIEDTDEQIRHVCAKFQNVHYLQNEFYEMENYIIFGSTLWSRIPEENRNIIESCLNDYRKIFDSNKDELITSLETTRIHEKSVLEIEKTIEDSKKKNKKLIVLTHHLPSFDLISEKFRGEKYIQINSAFASDLNHLFEPCIKYWICGHSHSYKTIEINGTKLVLNPVGYSHEHSNYNSSLVLDL